jgi:DNA invertase Pin-like site-specific DNA recombinase
MDTSRAVAYYRMSTGRQEASIPDQRQAVEKLAAKEGLTIIREYVDEGISGADAESRPEFLRMRDSAAKGEFAVILCWDQDRFGRFDSLDAGYWIKPIRDAGVTLHTVAQGLVDWEGFGGRLLYSVAQEGKNQFLKDLSRNVVRSMLAKALRGEWLGGPVPYGYVSENKRLKIGDAEQVRTVRRIFNDYVYGGQTMGQLVDALNRDGIHGPGVKLWCKTAVHKILTRPVYKGVMCWNRRHMGKFHEVKGGEVAAAARLRKTVRANGAGEWIEVEAPHLAIVEPAVWELAQKRLIANRDNCSPGAWTRKRVFLFTGLLSCTQCGWPMHGTHQTKGGYIRYICGNYNVHGRAGCSCNTVLEDDALRTIVPEVQAYFRRPEVREVLRAEIRRQEEAERRGEENPLASLNARIAVLSKKIDEGAESWLTAPAGLKGILADKLEEWRKERDRLIEHRKEVGKPAPTVEDLDAAVDRILEGMDRLPELIAEDRAAAKAVLKGIVEKVECRFQHVPYGKRQKSQFVGGCVHIRPDLILCRPVPCGNPLTIVTPARARPEARRATVRRP